MVIDDVLAYLGKTDSTRLRALFERATVLRVQNVADMYALSPRDEWSVLEDFPCIMPPWPLTWIEWKTPRIARFAGETRVMSASAGVAALVEVRRASDTEWLTKFVFFGERAGVVATTEIRADRYGRPSLPGAHGVPAGQVPWGIPKDTIPPGITSELYTVVLNTGWLFPSLLALSLCHCSNVTIEPEDLDRSLLRAREKRGRAPVTRFYTLDIASMSRELQASGASSSLRQALHMCRGHFKDYREGGGLFGKHHGLYWWDVQARGSAALGEIRKDYSIGEAGLEPKPDEPS